MAATITYLQRRLQRLARRSGYRRAGGGGGGGRGLLHHPPPLPPSSMVESGSFSIAAKAAGSTALTCGGAVDTEEGGQGKGGGMVGIGCTLSQRYWVRI